MKLTKKKVFLAALAICLIAILSMGTLAWFNAQDEAENIFYVTNADEGEDAIFSVDITEFVADDGDTKKPVDTGYTFNDILPGDVLTKQPFVTNTGSYDQFIRVTIKVSDLGAFKNFFGTEYKTLIKSNFLGNLNIAQLELDSCEDDVANDQLVFVFYVNEVVSPKESIELFNKTMIPYALEQKDFAETTLSDGFEIDLFAEAIQTENLGDSGTAKGTFEYYEAFNAVMP